MQPYAPFPQQAGAPGYGYGYGYPGPDPYAVQRPPLAGWWARVGANLIDGVVMSLVPMVCYFGGIAVLFADTFDCMDRTDKYAEDCEPSGAAIGGGLALFAVGAVLSIAITLWMLYRQGKTGQTLGKRALSISVVRETDGMPTGFGMAVVRYLCHFIDSITFVGYLWPLWDDKKQTFADKMVGTVVIRTG
ncbi:RDD family protein [Streptomyces stramineus]|uniref:RDD family protein n=1 Tax=Streptomyces TaxID=1883 RepID=UPI0031CFC20E